MDPSFKAGHEVCDVNLRTVTSGQRGMVGLCCVFFCRISYLRGSIVKIEIQPQTQTLLRPKSYKAVSRAPYAAHAGMELP